jgi:putative tryptophan/tyrosine transport system substrate-binding protein
MIKRSRFINNLRQVLPGITGILILGGILLITDLANRKSDIRKPDIHRVAMVHFMHSRDCDDVQTGILERYAEEGYTRDVDFIFDEFNAQLDVAILNEIVKVISEREYDLIYTTTLMPTQGLAKRIRDIPILFTVLADPVGNGMGSSYEDHISNVTGIDGMSYTDEGVDLVRKYIPGVKKIGMLYPPGEMAAISGLREMERACREQGIELVTLPTNAVTDVTDATTLLCMKDIDAVCQMPDAHSIAAFSSMVKVTRRAGIPLFCFISSQVEEGAVAAIAGDFVQQGREIADIGFRIVSGESPAGIPFSRLKQVRTVINPRAAAAYGLETPADLLAGGAEIVEGGQ